jgi:hypothetical protein
MTRSGNDSSKVSEVWPSARLGRREKLARLVRQLSTKNHPTVQRGSAFFATAARLYSHRVGDALDGVAKADSLIFNETVQAHAMRLAFDVTRSLVFGPYFKQAKTDEVVTIIKAREPARTMIAAQKTDGIHS